MPKLDFKEKKNLYEKIRMEKEEKQTWEEDLEVKITPERKARIECYKDILDFIEDDGWTPDKEEILKNAFANINNEEINEKIQQQNKRVKKERVCVKCGDWTKKEYVKEENGLVYCPYCWEVCFGGKDENWPPKINKQEPRGRGFSST